VLLRGLSGLLVLVQVSPLEHLTGRPVSNDRHIFIAGVRLILLNYEGQPIPANPGLVQ
jgi:hypothetical protein